MAKLGQQQADQQTELVAQQIRFEVLKSYYGVLLAQSRVVVADEAIQIATADLKRIKDKFETGFVVRSDLLAAEVQLSEFRQQKIEASGELAIAQAALNTALGLPVNSPHTITDQLSERLFTVETQDELIRLAIEQRPEYARAMLAVRSNARQVRGARDEVLPRVDAFAGVGASGRSPVTGSSDYTVGAAVTVNLFDAGRKARINQARATEAIAVAEQEQLANQISFEVVRAYQQFVSARERLQVVAQTTAQASEVLRIVQDRYREGLTTITEVLRAAVGTGARAHRCPDGSPRPLRCLCKRLVGDGQTERCSAIRLVTFVGAPADIPRAKNRRGIDEIPAYFRCSHSRSCWSQLMRQKTGTSNNGSSDGAGRKD